ncbi:release factor glutamine methyltransferase [Natronospira proteinivora]|uniref:Release factor glutamine methyltransferase n=1 Tax=Natronospira proteinivora TaxID=1807133 RepID=A0ABT1GAN1_9GAMM|nr:peptide chain release factor N(5)-glutamine methyltransferase [Natronospira proteinivora]MCP1727368.1 release factor glutamine methyltransferase [Natronospira proteinivora]
MNNSSSKRLDQLQQWAVRELSGVSDEPRLEARILLAHASGLGNTTLIAFPEREVSETQARSFQALVRRRAQGEPVAYLTEGRAFWTLNLKVGPATLIPRPETERLVELAVEKLPREGVRALDMGTGSGAIALALASERPAWTVLASEINPDTLAMARENARNLGLTIELIQSDWFEAIQERELDLIVSNPPYIPDNDPHLGQGDLRFEPSGALAAGADGLRDIRRLVEDSPHHLRSGGFLMLEHGFDQDQAVRELLEGAGFCRIETHKDLAGHPRITTACLYK